MLYSARVLDIRLEDLFPIICRMAKMARNSKPAKSW